MSILRVRGAAAFLVLSAISAHAGIRYVDASLTTGSNNGSSWANAYQGYASLPDAISVSVSGDQIWVRAGTYTPTPLALRTVSIRLKNGVEIYGGFAGTETLLSQRDPTANVTTLSGDLFFDDTAGSLTDNSYHVVNGNSTNATAVLDGFRIAGGYAFTSGSNQDRGAGLLCLAGSSPTIRNCDFVRNRCLLDGAGAYVSASNPTFTNCRFEGNVASGNGGGVLCEAGGLPVWDRCTFFDNIAVRGGALDLSASSHATLTNCLLRSNIASGAAGGGALFLSNSDPLVVNCTVAFNNAPMNTVGAGIEAGASTPTIVNGIFWNNNNGTAGSTTTASQIHPTTLATVTYSIVRGGYAGTGNSSADPRFTNVTVGNYLPTAQSPAIDAGNNAAVLPGIVLDLAGNTRFANEPTVPDTGSGSAPIVDCGAFEVPAGTTLSFCAGDGIAGASCPCGNHSPAGAGEGCLSSLGIGGELAPSGNARVGADTFELVGTQMPNSSALYFQGTARVAGGAGSAFGDGLRCAGGSILRLGTKTNSAGTSRYPGIADPSVSVRGGIVAPGTVRTYQCWYRNSAGAFCTPSTFNLTNGLEVTWAP